MGSPVWGSDPGTPAYLERQPLTNTNYKVDVDRPGGTQIRFTGQGMAIYMHFAEPGYYYNDHGKRVPDVVAASAGYDIKRLAARRKANEAMAKLSRDLDAELNKGDEKVILAKHEEYQVVEVMDGLYNVEYIDADDGTAMLINTRGPLTFEMAAKTFAELTGVELSAAAESSQPGDADVEKAAHKRAK